MTVRKFKNPNCSEQPKKELKNSNDNIVGLDSILNNQKDSSYTFIESPLKGVYTGSAAFSLNENVISDISAKYNSNVYSSEKRNII